MKIYISGPITGTDDYMERFQKAEDELTAKGHTVYNPAHANSFMPEGTTYEEYMKISFCLLDMADTIYMMDGWEKSKGANMELARAMEMGLKVYYQPPERKQQLLSAFGGDNSILQVLQPMMEHICDNLCVMPKKGYDKEKLDEACAGCELSQHIRNILNTYDKVNSFGKTQAAKLMEKYSSITLCEECEYRAPIKATDDYWCRLGNGIDGCLNPGDGCSRGKRKEDKD